MDTINENELQTHQAMDSRHMRKVNCSDKKYRENILLSINIVILDKTYMILVVSIYVFLATVGLLNQSSPKKIIFLYIERDTIKFKL